MEPIREMKLEDYQEAWALLKSLVAEYKDLTYHHPIDELQEGYNAYNFVMRAMVRIEKQIAAEPVTFSSVGDSTTNHASIPEVSMDSEPELGDLTPTGDRPAGDWRRD